MRGNEVDYMQKAQEVRLYIAINTDVPYRSLYWLLLLYNRFNGDEAF